MHMMACTMLEDGRAMVRRWFRCDGLGAFAELPAHNVMILNGVAWTSCFGDKWLEAPENRHAQSNVKAQADRALSVN